MPRTATKPKPATGIRLPKANSPKPKIREIAKPEPSAEAQQPVENPLAGTPLAYAIDTLQRHVLFWDVIRKRADIFLEHESEGLSPVLNFEYETVLDARTFKQPCNYALLKITAYGDACLEDCLDENKPPVIIVDPRAGHGPGIGGFNPGLGIMNVSYSEDLAKKFMREFRVIVESAWYRKAFPEMQIAKNTETEITTTANGFRFAASVGGSLTGRGADIIIIDDPLKAGGADSDARRTSCNEWFGNTLYSRLNHKKTSSLILVMQRLHQEDLTGYLQKSEEFHTLSLPAIALHDETIPLRYGDAYHRKCGEPLHEKWENLETLGHIKKQLGSYLFSAQYQQQPVPAEGNLYKRNWMRLFDGSPGNDGVRFWSWDIANAISENADYSVGTYWHANKSGSYLLDVVRVQVEFTQLKQLILAKARETGTTTIIIEKNGIGLPLFQSLQNSGLNVLSFSVKTDKKTRAIQHLATFEAGRVFFKKDAPWLDVLLNELLAFPQSKYDDQVDSIMQALSWAERNFSPQFPQLQVKVTHYGPGPQVNLGALFNSW